MASVRFEQVLKLLKDEDDTHKVAGLALASSLPRQPGYSEHQHGAICESIHAAAWPFLRRLLMPLRAPNTIATIQDPGKLQEQLSGTVLALSVLSIISTAPAVARDTDLHELLPVFCRLIRARSLAAACGVSMLPANRDATHSAEESACGTLANMLQHDVTARRIAVESGLFSSLRAWLADRPGKASLPATQSVVSCLMHGGTLVHDMQPLGQGETPTEAGMSAAEDSVTDLAAEVVAAFSGLALLAAADAPGLLNQPLNCELSALRKPSIAVDCSEHSAKGPQHMQASPQPSSIPQHGVAEPGDYRENRPSLVELQLLQIEALRALAVILPSTSDDTCIKAALSGKTWQPGECTSEDEAGYDSWRLQAMSAALRILQTRGKLPPRALEAALLFFKALSSCFGVISLFRLPQALEPLGSIDSVHATAAVAVLAQRTSIEVFSFLQAAALRLRSCTSKADLDQLGFDPGIFCLCLDLQERLFDLMLTDSLEDVSERGQDVTNRGRDMQADQELMVAAVLSDEIAEQIYKAILSVLKDLIDFLKIVVDAEGADGPAPEVTSDSFQTGSQGAARSGAASADKGPKGHDSGHETATYPDAHGVGVASYLTHTQDRDLQRCPSFLYDETDAEGHARAITTGEVAVLCCAALPIVMSIMPCAQTDRLLRLLPSVCAWALEGSRLRKGSADPGTIDSATRMACIAHLAPIVHFAACQGRSGPEEGAAQWRAALLKPTVLMAFHGTWCYTLRDACTLADVDVWDSVLRSPIRQLCEVLVHAVSETNYDTCTAIAEMQHDSQCGSDTAVIEPDAGAATGALLAVQLLQKLTSQLSERVAKGNDAWETVALVVSICRLIVTYLSKQHGTPPQAVDEQQATCLVCEGLWLAVAMHLAEIDNVDTSVCREFVKESRSWPRGGVAQLVSQAGTLEVGGRDSSLLERTLQLCACTASLCSMKAGVAKVVRQQAWLGVFQLETRGDGPSGMLTARPEIVPLGAALRELAEKAQFARTLGT